MQTQPPTEPSMGHRKYPPRHYPPQKPSGSNIFCCCLSNADSYVPPPDSGDQETPRSDSGSHSLQASLPTSPLGVLSFHGLDQYTPLPKGSGVNENRPCSVKNKFPNAKVVVGVDFGTTYSGFSFIMIPDDDSKPQRVHTFKDWKDHPPRTASAKTPTIINYSVSPSETVATHWGWTVDAITKEPQYHRVERCKLLLQESHSTTSYTSTSQSTFLNSTSIGSRSRESNSVLSETETQYGSSEMEQKTKVFADIELPSGILPVDVIADYLAFLFEVIQQEVSSILRLEGISNPLNLDQYVYCFTVPVFWSLAQQNTMREAVFKAKMISNFDSKNLMFCEEAVAGLLSFINMPAVNLALPCDVLVLDAGGGTVDLFQCKILANKDIAEVTQADGGFFGSTLVDRFFWDFIKNTIGPQAYNELWNNPTLRTSKVDFINIWDGIKRSFDENESVWADEMMGGYKHINLSWELCKVIPQHILDTLPSSGEIRLQKHHLKSFFDPAIQEITKMVINQLDASGKTSYNQLDALVMIGGFCNNQYLRDTILKHPKIAPRVKSVPNIPEPESAVVQGASWYAFDRSFVSERKSRFTLGIRVLRPFNQWKDRQIDVVNLNDPQREWKVNRGFSKFVEIGQSVSYGSVYTQTVQIFKGVQRANVEILKSDKLKDVTDMDEGGVTSAGQFNINVSEWLYTCPKWNRLSLTVNIDFGELELWVKVLPVLQAGQYMSEQELESVAIRTTMKIDEVRLELYSASQPRSNLSKIPSYSADEFNLVVLELCVNETSKKKAKRFDRLVADAIKACDNPLFKAAFLSTVIYEYLFPITNKPYDAAEKLAAVEDRLWKVLMSLEKLAKSRRGKNFESQLNELSPLLNGFEFVVKKGSINIFSKIYRRIVGDEVANALIDVFRRNPKSFATGAPMTSAIGMVNDRDEEPYDSDSLAVSQGSIRENGSLINVSQNSLNTSSSASLDERSSAYSNWSSGSQSSKSSKFDHLNADFRSKVLRLQKDRFRSSHELCKERKYYHDIFISYRREPKSEMARDWLTLALGKINERRKLFDHRFHWFVDVDCLEDGQPFTEQFLEALLHAKVVFLLITEETLNRFKASGDNVILEWEWALYLQKLHSKQKFRIEPLFIGNVDPVKDFDFNAVNVRLQSANNDLTQKHPLELSPQELSFKEVFDTIFALNGQNVDYKRKNFVNQINCLIEGNGSSLRKILNG